MRRPGIGIQIASHGDNRTHLRQLCSEKHGKRAAAAVAEQPQL